MWSRLNNSKKAHYFDVHFSLLKSRGHFSTLYDNIISPAFSFLLNFDINSFPITADYLMTVQHFVTISRIVYILNWSALPTLAHTFEPLTQWHAWRIIKMLQCNWLAAKHLVKYF